MKPNSASASRFYAWAGIFLSFRLLCLHFFVDAAWTPEETYRGTMALELLRGPKLPLWCYQPDQYLGGSYVTAVLAAINYRWLGVRLISLKLTAILFALVALLAGYRWLAREAGTRAADAFAFLYTFAPPTFVFLGAVAMGYHTESAAFLPVLLALASSLAAEPRPRTALLFGLVGGFAFWFSNINALAVLAGLAVALRSSRPRARAALAMALGGLIGAAPWLARNLATGFSPLSALTSAVAGARHDSAAKVLHLFTRALPLSSGLPTPLAYAWLALLLLAVALAWRRLPPSLKLFLPVYAALFTVFYGLSRYQMNTASGDPIQFRYLQPLLTLIFLSAAAGRRAPLLAALGALSLYGIATHERVAPPGRAWDYRPYSYEDLSARMMSGCYAKPSKLAGLLEWIRSEPSPVRTYLEIPFTGAYDFAPLVAGGDSGTWPHDDPWFSEGLGKYLATNATAPQLLETSRTFRGPVLTAYWRGVAEGVEAFVVPPGIYGLLPPDTLAIYRSFHESVRACFSGGTITPAAEERAAKGQGIAVADCGVTVAGIREKAESLAQGQSEEFRRNLSWGLGCRLRMRHLPDPARSYDRIQDLPAWARESALRGAADCEHELGLGENESVLRWAKR